MRISDLDTPAIIIDLDRMDRNLTKVADYARSHNLRLRPHTKTHKIPALGRRQVELGAVGLSVAKSTEAEVMLKSGTPDILVAYPVVGEKKLARLTEIARKANVTVSLDSMEAAKPLSRAAWAAGVEIGVLTEMDVGLHRVGVQPGADTLALARAVSTLPGLRWRGIAFYPGHIKDFSEKAKQDLATLGQALTSTVALLKANGLAPEVVSGGSTPLLWVSHTIPEMNEIRPGTYIFNDRNTILSGACSRDECAATILTTVVSVAPWRFIIDGGSKTFSSDRLSGASDVTFGEILEAPGARFHKMNEEHGFVELAGDSAHLSVGDRVHVLPNHICVAMNLHEQVYGVRGDEVVETWVVEGRGKLQ
ncbi:alanine racemase [uncultured Paludibaculum sp.]|uniref:alanine racemase n=1 Tax=uncultured Paludibaculum sp. TaxID=1765020 RepID=UPI002AAAE550|nr:alanine racemase [uncultured Paludibaculum sp.]